MRNERRVRRETFGVDGGDLGLRKQAVRGGGGHVRPERRIPALRPADEESAFARGHDERGSGLTHGLETANER